MSGGVENTPKLRFPEFSGGWDALTLDGVCELQAGNFVKASEIHTNATPGLFPCYGGNGLRGYVNAFNRDGKFSLVGRQGALCGNVHFAEGRFYATEHALVAEAREGNSIEWLFFKLGQMNLNQYSTGLAQPGISAEVIKQVGITLPKLPEQQKIAAFLGAVDAKIGQMTRKKALLEEYKKGCMQQLFTQKLRFKDDNGNDFPDWEEKTIETCFDWVRTNSLSRDKLNHDADGEVQNIHYGDIHSKFHANFKQRHEEVPHISGSLKGDFSDSDFCKLGDVVIADASEDYADIGKAIEIVELTETPLVAGLHTYIARPKDGKITLGFAGYLLRSAGMRKQIMRIAQGISVLGISKGNLGGLTLALPHPDEQQKIADFLSAIDAKISLVADELDAAQDFKKGLLQQMFV